MTQKTNHDVRARLRDIGEWLIQLSEDDKPETVDEVDVEVDIEPVFRPAIPLGSERRRPARQNNDIHYSRLAMEEWRDRDRRARFFDEDLFGEPAWDMLLDFYIAYVVGRRISVTSACIASNVPHTTALRWLDVMEERGLLDRTPDRHDKRRTWIALTDAAYVKMCNFLEERARTRMSAPASLTKIRKLQDSL